MINFKGRLLLILFGGAIGITVPHAIANVPGVYTTQQNGTCQGIVKDESGETIIGASVLIKGTSNGVITDINGAFSISGVKQGDVVQVSFIGFKTIELAWNGKALNITMKQDNQMLDEVVVVGFGTQKKVNLTGSVAVVGGDELTSRPVTSITQALQGLVPGMNFSYGSAGGRVGSSMNVDIRGTGTLDSEIASGSPLILIDGTEGDMNMLNPNDVESISVLKDAAASSIYGSRAPYGVVLITTKKGQAGKVSINYNNSFRWSQAIGMAQMAGSYDFARYINQVEANDGKAAPDRRFTPEHLQRVYDYQHGTLSETTFPDAATPSIWNWKGNGNVDWLDEIFGGTGFSQEHSFSVGGGTEKLQYYFSANYMDQGGVLRYGDENMQRYTINGKISSQLTSWLKFSYNVRFMRKDMEQPYWLTQDGFYNNVQLRWPTQPVLDPNGNYLTELPKQLMWGGTNNNQTDWTIQQGTFEITPIKNWKTFVEVNYKTINTMYDEVINKMPCWDVAGEVYYNANSNKNSAYAYGERTNFFNTNIYSEYLHQWGDHTLKGMVGFQSELNKYVRAGGKGEDLITESVPNINTTTGKQYAYGKKSHWATAGFFGRINYNYKERYLAEANIRYDGTSRFAADSRWALYPSFSLGWNIAREAFMEDTQDVINNLKLRGSWGKLGNQNTKELYPYIQTMPYNFAKTFWLINDAKINTSNSPALISSGLTWETMSSWNVGFDLGMLNNRLNLSFDWFVRTTYDMVGPAPELPAVLGTNVPRTNNADLRSTGFELDLSWRDQIRDFRYGVHFLLSDDRQKVLKYPNRTNSLKIGYREGEYLNEIWGLTTIGIAKSQEEMDAHLGRVDQSSLSTEWYEGDIMYEDTDHDGRIYKGGTTDEPGDLSIIGNSTPRFKFGFDLDAAWKGFDIRMFFQGVAKRDWAFAGGHYLYWGNAGGIWGTNCYENNLDFYRADNGEYDDWIGPNTNAKFPRLTSSGKNRQTQTRYLENAAYIRMKNLQFGYTLPQAWTSKAGISKLRVFFSAENVFTLTGLPSGIDPETLGGLSDYGGLQTYPLTRTFSAGLSVNF